MSDDATRTRITPRRENDSGQSGFQSVELHELPTVTVQVSTLRLDNSPRRNGETEGHIRVLAETGEKLPPIIVHAQSMRVIDGAHRVRAAVMRGAYVVFPREVRQKRVRMWSFADAVTS
jgi:hypothetical protein